MKPDYSKYNYFELLDSLKNIDKDQYPDRFEDIKNEIELIKSKFPFVGVSSDSISESNKEKSLFSKVTSYFSEDNRLKDYGGIDAYVSEYSTGKLHASSVSAYLVEDDGNLYLVLRGYYSEGDNVNESRIRLNASGLNRLKEVILQAEEDITNN